MLRRVYLVELVNTPITPRSLTLLARLTAVAFGPFVVFLWSLRVFSTMLVERVDTSIAPRSLTLLARWIAVAFWAVIAFFWSLRIFTTIRV